MDHPQASRPVAAQNFQNLVQRYHRADLQRAAAEKELLEIRAEMSSFLDSVQLSRCSALVRVPRPEHQATGFVIAPCDNYVYTVDWRAHGKVSVTSSLLLGPGEQ